MLQLYVNDRLLDLLPDTSIALEINNPIFFDDLIQGSFSYPFTLPLTPANRIILEFPDVIENMADVRQDFPCLLLDDEAQIRGVLKLRKIIGDKATVNLQVGISGFMASLQNKKISEFEYGGERQMGATWEDVVEHMHAAINNPDQFDYIFAPFRNNYAYAESEEELDGLSTYVNNFDYFNVPGGGVEYRFSGGSFHDSPRITHHGSVTPLVWLKYVFFKIFEELEVRVSESFFDAELESLVIVSNVLLDEKIQGGNSLFNDLRKSFTIAELLPEITVVDFLKRLSQAFGLSPQVSLSNELVIQRLKDVIESLDYIEMTHKAGLVPEQEIKEKEGITLMYAPESGDMEAGEKIKEIDPGQLKPAVATLADLPVVAKSNDVRLVVSLNQYYSYYIDAAVKEWRFYSENYLPLKIAGGGKELPQGIATTLVKKIKRYEKQGPSNHFWKVPLIGVEGFSPAYGHFNKSEALRLLFYRGMHPWDFPDYPASYPLITDDNFTGQGVQVGNYSLRLEGEFGTYEKFLKPWLDFKINHKTVKLQIALDKIDMGNLNLNRKWNISGNRYLVKKLSLTLPLRKPATAELWKCKI